MAVIDVSEAIGQIVQERNISEEMAIKIVEDTLLAAYKRKFGIIDNAEIRFTEDKKVSIHAKRTVVDGVYDPVTEVELEDTRAFMPDAEVGDEIIVELDPRDFERGAVQTAKQIATAHIRDIRKDSLYTEFKEKEGSLIIGYYQRERNGTIYVNLGKIEGVLRKKYQSPREIYQVNDRIKALVFKVEKTSTGLNVELSRTHSEFVRAVFEAEVPEIYDKTVEIHKIVREPGYRTKLAVYTSKLDIDPVGACVGMKGVRIQSVIREMEGEKIDVLRYDPNPQNFIKNALSPAEVREVIILDEAKHQALAIVNDSQLSLAIGKQGLNVRLANRLCDWNIDVKTVAQFEEMDISAESRRAVSQLFGDEGELSKLSELPDVDKKVVSVLEENGIEFIEDFLNLSSEKLSEIKDISEDQLEKLRALINEFVEVEIVEDDDEQQAPAEETKEELKSDEVETEDDDSEVEEYECPDCGAKITLDMTKCPNCGIGLSFEFDE
ncbi:MAG: transcription termination factor NusA [Termitinemataceae bacterium]|nr:MAG: transcription termination factor NusA [Termitinemataceae bacterium]